jgi:hypothetical protein
VTAPLIANSLIDRLAEARSRGDFQAFTDVIPYAQFLGLSGGMVDGELVTTMRYGDHLIGNPALPALHGGTLGALLESAAIFEMLWRAETIVLPSDHDHRRYAVGCGRRHACARNRHAARSPRHERAHGGMAGRSRDARRDRPRDLPRHAWLVC